MVPGRPFGKPAKRNPQRPDFDRREVRNNNHRYLGHSHLLACLPRATPEMIVKSWSTRIGSTKPKRRMAATRPMILASLWSRACPVLGRSRWIGTRTMGHALTLSRTQRSSGESGTTLV
jgi:hypothetical protein